MKNPQVKVKKVYIGELGELHIITEEEELIFKPERTREIVLDNAFPFRNRMHNLFQKLNDVEREKLIYQVGEKVGIKR